MIKVILRKKVKKVIKMNEKIIIMKKLWKAIMMMVKMRKRKINKKKEKW